MRLRIPGLLCLLTLLIVSGAAAAQARPPQQVAGTWRIVRILPANGAACWTDNQAQPLVGTLLQYGQTQMQWQGGNVPLNGVTTRTVTAVDFAKENPGRTGDALKLADLGIRPEGVTEVDMQHEDADVTGSTTEIPGDAVMIAGRDRIVVSACGVYMEARRVAPRSSAVHSAAATRPGSSASAAATRKGM